MVHMSLSYYGNATSSKTIFGVIFFQFLIFKKNFWHLKCSDFDAILHEGSPWCDVPPVKIWSKTVILKRGYNIIFLYLYSEKTCFFFKFRYLKIFRISKFFTYNLIRVYCMCMQNFRTIFQLFSRVQVEKRPKIGNFRDLRSNSLQRIFIWHPKNALRVMKFF